MDSTLQLLPLNNIETWETRQVLKQCAVAHRYLAELKGIAATIPNEAILVNTLLLQEAKDSSAIENIITSQNELYRQELMSSSNESIAAKEVQDYVDALQFGVEQTRHSKAIRLNTLLNTQQIIEKSRAGIRKPSTVAPDSQVSDEVIHTPPQNTDEINELLHNLVAYINGDIPCDADPLVKMAVIHHQFQSIQPFYEGNGRTGRILDILFLVVNDLLDLPVLYLSRYILNHKSTYYDELQRVRETTQWEPWILYLLKGVTEAAQYTITLIQKVKRLMSEFKEAIQAQQPKMYHQELLNNVFHHPYTKIEFVMEDLNVSRLTASKYLETLVSMKLLKKEKFGRTNYYINQDLFDLLIN